MSGLDLVLIAEIALERIIIKRAKLEIKSGITPVKIKIDNAMIVPEIPPKAFQSDFVYPSFSEVALLYIRQLAIELASATFPLNFSATSARANSKSSKTSDFMAPWPPMLS